VTTQAGTGRLVIDRPSGSLRNVSRRYEILVDGASVGTIAQGGLLSVDLQPGFHQVVARLGGTGSPPFGITITPSAYIKLRVSYAGRPIERYRRFSKTGYLRLDQH
jgi:hypothetical protein